MVERMRREMIELGYDEVHVDRMGNLIGRLGHGPRLLAVDGHCDTVAVGNPDSWEVDPLGGEVRDGVILGRGAADQKGGLGAAIYAGAIIKELGVPEQITLLVVASVLEEDVEGLSWRHLTGTEGIRPAAVLLTEPTGLALNIGQRGRLEIGVRVSGVSCHGSAPDRGSNAIYRIAPIILEVEALHHRLGGDSVLGKGSIAATDIRSTAPSLCAVADSATLHLDRRLTEGETRESALAEVRDLPAVVAAAADVFVPQYRGTAYTGLLLTAECHFPPWLMDRDHPLVETALQTYLRQFGEEARLGLWQFSTNGVITCGECGIPTIGFGPGEEAHAHTTDDQVRVDDLVTSMEFYAGFVLGWASMQREDVSEDRGRS